MLGFTLQRSGGLEGEQERPCCPRAGSARHSSPKDGHRNLAPRYENHCGSKILLEKKELGHHGSGKNGLYLGTVAGPGGTSARTGADHSQEQETPSRGGRAGPGGKLRVGGLWIGRANRVLAKGSQGGEPPTPEDPHQTLRVGILSTPMQQDSQQDSAGMEREPAVGPVRPRSGKPDSSLVRGEPVSI